MQRSASVLMIFGATVALGCAAGPRPPSGLDTSAALGPVPTAGPAPEPEPPLFAEVGKPAPDFSLTDLEGRSVALKSFRGRPVVLEWFNPECPFVRFNHEKGTLKDLAEREMSRGIVWLSINSAAPGKQGHGREANAAGRARYGMTNPILLDETGQVGRRYGARTTPHMFVIDAHGMLVYEGAVDNTPDGDPPFGDVTKNFVGMALDDIVAGKPVSVPRTEAYGCGVKYAEH